MENRNIMPLSKAIIKIAEAYIFIHINFNLGTIDLIPNWVGYLFILSALPALSRYDDSAMLLKPFGIVLGVSEFISWIMAMAGITLSGYLSFVTLIVSVINLYFHFQLITNVAEIAPTERRRKRLIVLRTVVAICFAVATVISVIVNMGIFDAMILFLLPAVIGLIMCLWILIEMFSLSAEIKEREETGMYYYNDM